MGLGVGAQLFATGLRHTPRGSVAVLAQLRSDAEPRAYELAQLHGDAAPPRLAADGNDLVIGLQEANASGHDLRVARVSAGVLGAPLVWRAAPHQTRDESNVFDLAARDGRVFVVWDEWSGLAKHGRVLGAVIPLDPNSPLPAAGQALSAPGADAEAPRISSRPGGYWVAWLVNEGQSAEGARVYDPGEQSNASRAAYGERAIEVMALDSAGAALGPALRVVAGRAGVVGYDLVTSPSGGAWLVWRQDAPTPGASGGRVMMADIRADGSFDLAPLEVGSVGAGEPSWLVSPAPEGPWLTLPDEQDRTLLMRVERPFETSAPVDLGSDLAGAAALAAAGSSVLFVTPRSGALEFFAAACERPGARTRAPDPFGLAPASDAAPGASQREQQ